MAAGVCASMCADNEWVSERASMAASTSIVNSMFQSVDLLQLLQTETQRRSAVQSFLFPIIVDAVIQAH